MIRFFLQHKNRFWLFVALLVAFFFRVYLLGAQSLWNDEGTSIALAARTLDAIISEAARDIHPPLYYFQLHYWLALSGNSEFAARFLSVIAGVLTVSLTYRIARSFFDVEVATVAAYFAAFSPFGVYYSQETRMYIWVTFWAGLSVLAMVWMLQVEDWRSDSTSRKLDGGTAGSDPAPNVPRQGARSRRTLAWLLYIVSTTAAMYSHYFGATVLAFENLSFAIWVWLAWRTNRPHLRHTIVLWLVAQAICIVAFLPWFSLTATQLAAWPAISEPFDLPTLLWRLLNVFSVGSTLDAGTAALAAIAFAVLVCFGLRLRRDPQTIWGVTLALAWMLVPVLAMYAVSVTRPAYNPKFLLLATPPFFILAARGLSSIYPGVFLRPRNPPPRSYLLRYIYFGIAVIAAVSFLPALQNYYYNPQYARDDYRAMLRLVDSNARVGDGILIDAPGQIDVVEYYHRGTQPVFLLPKTRPLFPNATRYEIDDIVTNQVKRVFAIYYGAEQADPDGVIETRLAQRGFKAFDEWHGNARLALYGLPPNPRDPGQNLDLRFGDGITLGRWQLDGRDARVGDVLTLTLNWVAISRPAVRYKVFVHLLDASGRVVAQRDGEPVADRRITTTWNAGENIADNYGLFVQQTGEYTLETGMYRADSGARLPIFSREGKPLGDHLTLGTVRVSP